MRWTESDIVAARSRLAGYSERERPKKRSKYRNVKTVLQGQVFDSKREVSHWKDFQEQQHFGAIRGVVRQVSFSLPSTRRRIRVDFMVVENDGRIQFYDSKGYEGAVSKLKRQTVFDAYGIEIKLL